MPKLLPKGIMGKRSSDFSRSKARPRAAPRTGLRA